MYMLLDKNWCFRLPPGRLSTSTYRFQFIIDYDYNLYPKNWRFILPPGPWSGLLCFFRSYYIILQYTISLYCVHQGGNPQLHFCIPTHSSST